MCRLGDQLGVAVREAARDARPGPSESAHQRVVRLERARAEWARAEEAWRRSAASPLGAFAVRVGVEPSPPLR